MPKKGFLVSSETELVGEVDVKIAKLRLRLDTKKINRSTIVNVLLKQWLAGDIDISIDLKKEILAVV